jgi:hypothetical protein
MSDAGYGLFAAGRDVCDRRMRRIAEIVVDGWFVARFTPPQNPLSGFKV